MSSCKEVYMRLLYTITKFCFVLFIATTLYHQNIFGLDASLLARGGERGGFEHRGDYHPQEFRRGGEQPNRGIQHPYEAQKDIENRELNQSEENSSPTYVVPYQQDGSEYNGNQSQYNPEDYQ